MGLGGVAIAVLPSMIYPKQPFSDGLGGRRSPNYLEEIKIPRNGDKKGSPFI